MCLMIIARSSFNDRLKKNWKLKIYCEEIAAMRWVMIGRRLWFHIIFVFLRQVAEKVKLTTSENVLSLVGNYKIFLVMIDSEIFMLG